jgi:pyruvate dehydrogenase E1 component alpha subunit
MLGKVVDGTDILEVYEVAREAIARARKGDGPTLIECKVRRWEGHYIGDPQKYRDPKDIEEARRVDPLSKFQKRLMDEKILTLESMNELDESVKREIEEAIQFAKSSPVASREQAFQNVYV